MADCGEDPVADAMPSGVEAEPVNGGFYPMLIGENVNAGTFGGNVQPVVEKLTFINTRTIRCAVFEGKEPVRAPATDCRSIHEIL